MKNLRVFLAMPLISSFFLSISCSKDSYPDCVDEAIKTMKKKNGSGQVWQYDYKGEKVFKIEYTYALDLINPIYDYDCNLICQSGGFAGYICADSILGNLTNGELLFSR